MASDTEAVDSTDAPKKRPCVRLLSWNVHQFRTAEWEPNAERVAEGLKRMMEQEPGPAHLTIVALQEVPPHKDFLLKRVAQHLGMHVGVFADALSGAGGNAILFDSHYSLPGNQNPKLSPLRSLIKMLEQETRSIASLLFRWPCFSSSSSSSSSSVPASASSSPEFCPDFRIFNTHLDHVDENLRYKQLQKAKENVIFPAITRKRAGDPETEEKMPFVLLGDMNSLYRPDYTSEDWERITQARRAANWELPQTRLMDELLHHGLIFGHPLQDCFSLSSSSSSSSSCSSSSSSSSSSPSSSSPSSPSSFPSSSTSCSSPDSPYTCWAGTRIDYHLLSHAFQSVSGHFVGRHEILYDECSPSDHCPLVTDFYCSFSS